MQNAPTPPARPPSTPGSAAAAAGAYSSHPALPMLSSLGPPGTMHAANGAPLPPFIPEGGPPPHSLFYHTSAAAAFAGGAVGHHHPGHGPHSGRTTPGSMGRGAAGGNKIQSGSRPGSKGGWTAPGAHKQFGTIEDDGGADMSASSHAAAHAAQVASSATPNGPPFVCAACKQTYSRLEYLRRHERRHADIRPFVCACGKGFSRSDVLGRHKKQCKAVVGDSGSKDGDSNSDREQGGPPTKKQRRSGGGRKKKEQDNSGYTDPSNSSFPQYGSTDASPSSSSQEGHNNSMDPVHHSNIDPALSALSQASLMDQELANSTAAQDAAGIFQPTADYAARIPYGQEVNLAFPFTSAPVAAGAAAAAAPNAVMTTSADVANAASVALAELAAAATATMVPSQSNNFGAAALATAGSSAPTSRHESQTWSPIESGTGSGSGSPSGNKSGDEANDTSPTPEQALLRVVGGSQEVRAGINSLQIQQALVSAPTFNGGGALVQSGSGAVGYPGAMSGQAIGMSAVPGLPNGAQTNLFSAQNNSSLEWILSPSIQQLMAWANASNTGTSSLGSDRSNFGYFQNVPGLSNSSSTTSLSIPSLSEDLAVLNSIVPNENIGDIQAAFGPGASAAAAASVGQTSDMSHAGGMGMFGGAGAGGYMEGAASAIANGVASESEPGLATALAALKRSQARSARNAFSEVLALDLQKAFTDPRNPFFIPQHLFRACYSIPHWDLPPLTRLSMLAFHSQKNLLKHFPFIHEPSFRIDTTPGCLAFATCMLGGSETGRKWWAGEETLPRPEGAHIVEELKSEGHSYDEEDGQVLVRHVVMYEKMDMLLRVFSVRCKSQLDRIAAVQCLSLLQWKELLEADPERRARAALTQQKVTAYARKSGFFDPKAEWTERRITYTASQVLDTMLSEAAELCFSYSFLPTYLPGCPDEEKIWRRWCDWEGRRRTAFILYIVDTVAHLDTGATMIVASQDVVHIPLPTPDYIWRATTPETWYVALENYRGPTLHEALHQLLGPGTEEIPPVKEMPSIVGAHGPFARSVMMFTLLRGVLALMEGRQSRVARPSPLLQYFGAPLAPDGGRSELRIFKHALTRWRKAWDGDALCKNVGWVQRWDDPSVLDTGDGMHIDGGDDMSTRASATASSPMFTSRTSHGATPLCDDALPFYWLGHVLLDHVSRGKKLPQRPVGSTLAAGKENISNKTKAKLSAGTSTDLGATVPDFRVLLKLAKQ
ncbi:hypothetical protein OC834_002962 [Tilletia horrida]|nr:hypothetical protein OC834_002962 [Tilletia horrida]